MKSKYLWVGLFSFFSIAFFILNGVIFTESDGYGCYHNTKTFVTSGSFFVEEKPDYYGNRGHTIIEYKDGYAAACPIGVTVYNIPSIGIGSILNDIEYEFTDYFFAYKGHSFIEGFLVLITATVLGVLSFFQLNQILTHFQISQKQRLLITISTFLSSYLLWYILLLPFFTHVYEVFSIIITLWGYTQFNQKKNGKYAFLVGLGAGLTVLTRPTLIFFAVTICLLFVYRFRSKIVYVVAGGLIPTLFYVYYSFSTFNKIVFSSYSEIRNESFGSDFNMINILFSVERGWFVYSPVMLLSLLIGGYVLLQIIKNKRFTTKSIKFDFVFTSFVTIVTTVLFYSFWETWWAGGSYGQRFFVALYPLVAIILGLSLKEITNKKVLTVLFSVIVALTVWSTTIMLLHRITPTNLLVTQDRNKGNLPIDHQYNPYDIISYNVNRFTNGSVVSSIIDDLNGGHSIAVAFSGKMDYILLLEDNASVTDATIFKAPVSSQARPGSLDFYIWSKGEVREYQISLSEDFLTFDCENECKVIVGDSIVVGEKSDVTSLSKQDYQGFWLGPNRIYFKNTFNLQFRGEPIEISLDQKQYYIP